jgi:hypothetical protein
MPALEDTIRKVTGKAAPRELLDGKFTPVVTVFDALDICDEVAQKAVDVGMMTTLREWAVQSREDYRRTGIFAGVMLVTTGERRGPCRARQRLSQDEMALGDSDSCGAVPTCEGDRCRSQTWLGKIHMDAVGWFGSGGN